MLLESPAALPTLSYSFQARRDDIRPMVEQVRRLVAEEADPPLPLISHRVSARGVELYPA